MIQKLSDSDARRIAALSGVLLDDDAARNVATAMAAPVAASGSSIRRLPFEAEPSQFLAAQRNARP